MTAKATETSAWTQNEIVESRDLSSDIRFWRLYCPEIAAAVSPGQFVVLRADDYSERIPLTVADFDRERGLITVIFQAVGASTKKMATYGVGARIMDVVGPLGVKSEIEKFGTVVCIGGGIGVAPVYPIAKALHQAGNKVVSIMGARSANLLILDEEMAATSDELIVTTDDGSRGLHGFVTDALGQLYERGEKIDRVVAIGPVVMMRAVANATRERRIPTVASLNSVMIDATGMCGCCRVDVGGETKFACVDGPEFDAHLVDFEELMKRQVMYQREEYRALWHHECMLAAESEGVEKAEARIPMPKQDHRARRNNFDEVALGYTREMAQEEALRCLQCKKSPCVAGCPVEIDIPAFIKLIQQGDFLGAARKIKEKNSLPGICGRVCPQEEQCEIQCVLSKKGQPVAIGRLERFAADYELKQGEVRAPSISRSSGKKVAVVGAGPAGLTVAGELAKMGHKVTIFEALHKPGGVLVYGIPEFRLPKSIVQSECDYVMKLGVEFRTSHVVGQLGTLDSLLQDGYDAIFVATGAGLPYFLGIPGENLNGVYSANEFLTRTNLMKAYLFPEYDTPIRVGKNVAVIGGGNVAMDSARCAVRLGAEKVYIVYRRSEAEMPARNEEIENAVEEGVILHTLHNPTRIIGDENGWVRQIELLKMKLGEPDSSGRRRPVPIEGTEHTLDVDVVVSAIGQGPNPLLTKATPDLELTKWGNIVADEETGKTNKKGVFAGGDIVTGAATVILAMGAGKKASRAIDEYLRTGEW
ncbi:MAG: NADPH-dependent glutamate synthase [Candidatus Eisenbacteria bacterium]|nr:NADPH-dependent glutamate synthase [Candidatus Eisenbacteria bacterium]